MVIGFEKCPTTGRPHLHIVMQLKSQALLSTIQAIVKPRVMNTKFPLRVTDPKHIKFAPDYCKKGRRPNVVDE